MLVNDEVKGFESEFILFITPQAHFKEELVVIDIDR